MTFRYKTSYPPMDLDYNHEFNVFCPDNLPHHLTWARFGSGGVAHARHCFVDDWRLEHLWRRPGQGLAKALSIGIITAPDYTIETHFPQELVSYQVWRSRVLTAYWQEYGVTVVPVLQWGCPQSFALCARGIRPGSVVAVRGPQRGTEQAWLAGARFMADTIQPSLVLHFGRSVQGVWPRALFLPLNSKKSLSKPLNENPVLSSLPPCGGRCDQGRLFSPGRRSPAGTATEGR